MLKEMLKKIRNNRTLSGTLRGILALILLIATPIIDGMIADKLHKLGVPNIPPEFLIPSILTPLIFLLVGIALIYAAFDKENKKIRENKALSVFLLGLGIIVIIVAIIVGISLYTEYAIEPTIIFITLLSLFAIGKLLNYNNNHNKHGN
jgi:ABC-type transport system involved in cytochrome c biogenesis permease subunit